jgi:hypothetical protein
MVPSSERTVAAFGSWQSAATLASAVVAIGLAVGWSAERADAGAVSSSVSAVPSGRCSVGDESSNFICRNTWLSHVRWSYR